jgi:hypothetical protein
MKHLFFLFACLLLASPAQAGPWIALEPLELPASGSNATLSIGAEKGKVDNIRFRIDGATVHLESLTLLPVEGDPIPLRIPMLLKSGESSGLINIPGLAIAIDKLKLEYRISGDRDAVMTVRLKLD